MNREFKEIQDATLALRTRTGDSTISSNVSRGKYRLVSVTYGPRGGSKVRVLSAYMPFDEFVSHIKAR